MKVTVCGAAGGIGQPLSLLLKMQLPAGSVLSLYDVINSPGVGEDISHINTPVTVETYLGDMKNPDNAEVDKALKGADIVVIPAGVPRKPGMTRDDLFKVNAGIVRDLINGVVRNCPKAIIAIITNPVNSVVPAAAEILKKHNCYDRKRLLGISLLDIVRAQTFIGQLKSLDPSKVKVNVVGGHSAETMLPLLSQVHGVKFTADEEKKLNERIREAGTAVVNAKAGAGSATLSMAYAAARFTNSIVRGLQGESGVQECAFVQVDNMETAYYGVPIELGKEGIAKILPVGDMNAYEKEQYTTLVPLLKQNIETGVAFATSQ